MHTFNTVHRAQYDDGTTVYTFYGPASAAPLDTCGEDEFLAKMEALGLIARWGRPMRGPSGNNVPGAAGDATYTEQWGTLSAP